MKTLLLSLLAASSIMAGETIPLLRTTKGTEYKNARVSEVEADGITIFHAGGVAKILFREMPDEMRRKYGYEPKAAAAAERAETAEQEQLAKRARIDAALVRIAQLKTDIKHADAVAEFERKRVASSRLSG